MRIRSRGEHRACNYPTTGVRLSKGTVPLRCSALIPNPQSPISNPQPRSPIPDPQSLAHGSRIKLSSPRRPWVADRFGRPGRSLWGRLRLLIRLVRRQAVSRTVLCWEGGYYLFLFVFVFTVAFLADMNLMMILAGMMVGPLWFSRRLVTATLRGLAIQRKMPHEICAGTCWS